MIAAFYGKDYSVDFLRAKCIIVNLSMSLQEISSLAEKIGFKSIIIKLSYRQLVEEVSLPAILQWNQEHFVVIYAHKASLWSFLPGINKEKRTYIADPNSGLLRLDKKTFLTNWLDKNSWRGDILLLQLEKAFYENNAL